ncbi:MAG: DUF4367 domain-containing protein [Clostridia bacterium]|nr:DUF4367 domain-containing protein [Clostridia bacterium]
MTEYNKHILKIVTDDILDENDELFLKEIEAAKADPRFANNKERDEKFRKALDEAFAVKKPRRKALVRAASVFLALILGLSVMTITVKGFREKLWEFLNNLGNHSYSSMLSSKNSNDNKLLEYEGMYIPKYIPEGYEVFKIVNEETYNTVKFRNLAGNIISYTEHTQNVEKKFNLDKEAYDSYETHTIKGKEIIITTKENVIYLTIKTNDAIIYVIFNDNNVDFLGFATHIEKK